MFNFFKKIFSKKSQTSIKPTPTVQVLSKKQIRGIVTVTDDMGRDISYYVIAERFGDKWFKIIETPHDPNRVNYWPFNSLLKDSKIEILEDPLK